MMSGMGVKEVQEVEKVPDRSGACEPGQSRIIRICWFIGRHTGSLYRFLSSRRRFLGKNNSNSGGNFGEVLGQ
jgi:hypothetical protein